MSPYYPGSVRANPGHTAGVSEADAQVIRRGYELTATRNWEAAREILAEDARWYSAMGTMMGKTDYVGFDEISRLVSQEIPSVLEGFRPELREVRHLGGEWSLAVVRWRATLRASGMELDQLFGQLCRIRDGRWHEMRSYGGVESALTASVVLRFLDAFNARDLGTLVALCARDVELRAARSRFEGAYTGPDGIRRWAGELVEWAPDYALHAGEVRVDGDEVHLHGHQRGTSVAGVPLDDPLVARAQVRGGLILQADAV